MLKRVETGCQIKAGVTIYQRKTIQYPGVTGAAVFIQAALDWSDKYKFRASFHTEEVAQHAQSMLGKIVILCHFALTTDGRRAPQDNKIDVFLTSKQN